MAGSADLQGRRRLKVQRKESTVKSAILRAGAPLLLLLLLTACSEDPASNPSGPADATLQTACNDGPATETAFAFDCDDGFRTCFLDLDLDGNGRRDFSRWGWSNGPYGPGEQVLDLYAGAGQCDIENGALVGQLALSFDGESVVATYTACGDYLFAEAHLYVGATPVPFKKNKPTVAPGQFPWSATGLSDPVVQFGPVPVETDGEGGIFVVAHAVVVAPTGWWGDCLERGCTTPCEPVFDAPAFEALAAGVVDGTLSVHLYYDGAPSYFPIVEVTAPGSPLAGNWQGWCVDLDHPIQWVNPLHPVYLFTAASSLADPASLAGLFEVPQAELGGRLARLNWVLNQAFVGAESPGCGGAYTFGDVQRAIWTLIEDDLSGSHFALYDACRAQEIVDLSQGQEDYRPPCDGVAAMIIEPWLAPSEAFPDGDPRQVLIVEIPAPCTTCD